MAVAASPAAAQAPCWRKVINDWLDNERIEGVYAQHCYREAARHVPEDLRAYSSIVDDISSARQQAVVAPLRSLATSNKSSSKTNTAKTDPNRALFKVAFNKLGPRNADSVPLPLLILAGLSLLLIAAGAAGLVAKRLRAAKIGPPAPKP
jgi:hypothetical protein